MTAELPWRRTHLAVPRADEALLAVPGFEATAAAARTSGPLLDACEIDVQGKSFSQLRHEAKREALRLATAFTTDVLGDNEAKVAEPGPLVVPGHQPALYHPGVWAKNFASARIADELAGSVLNLIVDNDIYSRPAIDVPAGTRDEPRREAFAFDVAQQPRPWERSKVKDREMFRSFAERLSKRLRTCGIDPVIEAAWPAAVERMAMCGTLPECLSAARHSLESAWGLHNLELPMSRLCETDAFLWFASHLLAQPKRFGDVYNGVLAEYRRLYRIKSRNHPVPALEERDYWLEAPFWVWRDDAPQRRRVFARQAGGETVLADETGHRFATLPLSPSKDACCAVEVLRGLSSQGIRFRTRALTTTLFARLFLADTFVHGIGGAKYDEMTDRIMSRFFGVPVPPYATVSASLYLPFAKPFDASLEDERRILELIRDLEQNPQRHLTRGSNREIDRLLDEKASLIAEQDAAAAVQGLSKRRRRRRSVENNGRFKRLKALTKKLAACTEEQQRHAAAELIAIRKERKANQVLTNREFSFAVFPESKLRPFMTRLANAP